LGNVKIIVALRAILINKFPFIGKSQRTKNRNLWRIDFYDYQICRREKFYRIATVL